MGHILNISKDRIDEIIHREVARGLRLKGLYPIVVAKSPKYCPFPASHGRDFDLDYQDMDLSSDYEIGQDEEIAINNIVALFPIRALEYDGIHENPYAHPGGGPAFNFPAGLVDHVKVTLPGSFALNLWEDDEETWDGRIDWEGLEIDPSMIAFVNR